MFCQISHFHSRKGFWNCPRGTEPSRRPGVDISEWADGRWAMIPRSRISGQSYINEKKRIQKAERKRENESQIKKERKDKRRRRTQEAKSSSWHERTSIVRLALSRISFLINNPSYTFTLVVFRLRFSLGLEGHKHLKSFVHTWKKIGSHVT